MLLVDKKIIRSYQQGNPEAFDHIYNQYSDKVYQFAIGFLKDQDFVKDLVQEVFISLWEKREQVDPDLNFENYIFTITYNAIRKVFKRRSVERKVLGNLAHNAPEFMDSIDGKLVYEELIELANRSIDNLPPRRKEVYKLSKQEGLKIKEIAARLNISPRTAEHHLAKALKYLKEELAGISLPAVLFFYLFLK